jgi:predicted GNAT superfamily acetyltransferase
VHIRLVDTHASTWGAELDRMGLLLRRDESRISSLLPYHFLHVTLPRIGGGAVWVLDEQARTLGVGFLFPRQREQGNRAVFTLRYHALPGVPPPHPSELAETLAPHLRGADVVVYDTGARPYYAATSQQIGPVNLGRPSAAEAEAVPALHAEIWNSPPEFIYPADLYSVDFAAGTATVARVEGKMVGFLLGFRKFGGSALPAGWHERLHGDDRLESQIMGVHPTYRGLRIANLLKKVQADQAWREGINLINWTSDPLQYPNAALNLGLLRAVAFSFEPDLYPFRNALNRVHASRMNLTWLVGSDRVRNAPMVGSRAQVVDLEHRPEILHVNEGLRVRTLDAEEPVIAIEVPPNWTAMQEREVALAQAWREVTDDLFAHYIGLGEGNYVLTGVAVRGDQRFLLAERGTPQLFAHLINGA